MLPPVEMMLELRSDEWGMVEALTERKRMGSMGRLRQVGFGEGVPMGGDAEKVPRINPRLLALATKFYVTIHKDNIRCGVGR